MIFNCPHCNQAIDADDSLTSQVVACPLCSKELTVPSFHGEVSGLHATHQPHLQTGTPQQHVVVMPQEQTIIPSVSTDKSHLTLSYNPINKFLLMIGVGFLIIAATVMIFLGHGFLFNLLISVIPFMVGSLFIITACTQTRIYACPVCNVQWEVGPTDPTHACTSCGHMVIIKWICESKS